MHLELVEKCKQNDRAAQLSLYKKYCDGMYCVAMRFLQNEKDAEDVLQEAFIKAFQKIEQYQGEVTFGAWLKKIVVNRSIDFLKAKREKTIPLEDGYMHVAEDDSWEVADHCTIEMVKLAINNLADTYKYVVQLFLLEGYDHQEIAEILAISETASRTRLVRGKAQLKEQLKQMDYGTGS